MLYLVATPIGHRSDISLRAIETLRSVDYVASEDTRHTGQLLKHLDISRPQISFHEHNKQRAGQRILDVLLQGKSVALVADAGTPGISDPGFTLIRSAIEAGIEMTMIPGASALIMALIEAGLTPAVWFEGDYTPRLKYLSRFPRGKVAGHFDIIDKKQAKEILGDTMCFWGNVPPQLLVTGTPQQVKDYVKELIERTSTKSGLEVKARIVEKVYEIGRKYSDNFKETMRIVFDEYLGQWNYRAIPEKT